MTKENYTPLKSVTLSFEKYGSLLDLPADEAGEVVQMVMTYGMTGKAPEIKDRYKKMFYQSFLAPVTEQMAMASKRAKQCREAADKRAAEIREAKRLLARQVREGKKKEVTEPTVTVDDGMGTESLSYDDLLSLGIKRDTGTFNGEEIWKSMADDDKRAAIAYAKQNIKGNATPYSSPYASQFLKLKLWEKKG